MMSGLPEVASLVACCLQDVRTHTVILTASVRELWPEQNRLGD